ncbi:MAG: NAD-dependent epimerase/dehydratase family protein [Mariprofundaceae bacterium]|nr:NAD-dependent epimerase/dehydratase family protein [Mariprofundaceae bacterium]
MKVLITGIRGFLATSLAKSLLQQGYVVRGFARQALPALDDIEIVVGTLEDAQAVQQAVQGCELVFHVAAKAGVWGDYDVYYQSNVVGTQHVIDACLVHGVARLVYTSSPSVVFSGCDEEGIDESIAYPQRYLCHYSATKAMAEKAVLAANSEQLATVALRPHLIWGEGDRHLVPRVLERGRAGSLRLIGADKQVDCTYIDNAVLAHTQAARYLQVGAACAGKAYFISNGEPMPMGHILNQMLACADLPAVTKRVSTPLAYALACLIELNYTLLKKKEEPLLTRFVVRQLSCAHWYKLEAAKKDLAYEPTVSIAQGMQRLRQSLQA